MDEHLTITVGSRERVLTVVTGQRPVGGAVFLGLHGSNQSPESFRRFTGHQFDRFAAHGVVGYPAGHQGSWNDARAGLRLPARRDGIDDVAFVRAAASELADRYGADPTRLYVFGYSNGGAMVLRLLHEIGVELSGAGIVSAAMPVPEDRIGTDAGPATVPLALIHGTRDRLVPYEGGMASLWGFRPRGMGISSEQTAQYFAERYKLPLEPDTQQLGTDGRTSVMRHRYGPDSTVVHYRVEGGGHTVPGPHRAPMIMGRTSRVITAAQEFADVWGLAEAATETDGTR